MLSFIVVHSDVGNVSQRNLIDAAVQAGVKRFAPSEWASYAAPPHRATRFTVRLCSSLQVLLRVHGLVRWQS